MRSIAFAVCLSVLVGTTAGQAARIPFVGCPSDGQNGPQPVPRGKARAVDIVPRFAARLAFYRGAYDGGVIAPRGWHCVSLYGSNGAFLVVTPQARTANDLLFHHTLITGPAIQMSYVLGGTSGRFEVASVAARYFPKYRAFVDAIIREKLVPPRDFVFSPYPADRFIHREDRWVQVETPPHMKGLGTSSRLRADDLPIRSVAHIDDRDGDPNLTQLTIKLLPEARDLLPIIAGQVRQSPEP